MDAILQSNPNPIGLAVYALSAVGGMVAIAFGSFLGMKGWEKVGIIAFGLITSLGAITTIVLSMLGIYKML